MINLVNVQVRDKYQLYIEFSNGISGIYDCTPLSSQSVFHRFDDEPFFHQVKIMDNNLVWDENLDIDGMGVYYKITGFNPYEEQMVQISQFCGIIISMYFGDHNPPHFHAKYGDLEAMFKISDGGLMKGHLPAKIHGLVIERRNIHHEELGKCRQKAIDDGVFPKVKPLE